MAVDVPFTDVIADREDQYSSSYEDQPLRIRGGGGRDTFEVCIPAGNALGFTMTIVGGTGLPVVEDSTLSDIHVGDIVTQLNGFDIDFEMLPQEFFYRLANTPTNDRIFTLRRPTEEGKFINVSCPMLLSYQCCILSSI